MKKRGRGWHLPSHYSISLHSQLLPLLCYQSPFTTLSALSSYISFYLSAGILDPRKEIQKHIRIQKKNASHKHPFVLASRVRRLLASYIQEYMVCNFQEMGIRCYSSASVVCPRVKPSAPGKQTITNHSDSHRIKRWSWKPYNHTYLQIYTPYAIVSTKRKLGPSLNIQPLFLYLL